MASHLLCDSSSEARNPSRILAQYHFPGKDERTILFIPGRPALSQGPKGGLSASLEPAGPG